MWMAKGVHGHQSVAVVLVIVVVIAVTAEQRVRGPSFEACSRDSRAVLCVCGLSDQTSRTRRGELMRSRVSEEE